MNRLVVFTSHYPYGNGEPFLEEEIKIAETCFSEIVIVTYAKQNEALTRYVPKNAKVIQLRKDNKDNDKLHLLSSLFKFIFRFRTWREIYNGIRERGVKKLITIIKMIFLFERHIDHIKKNEELCLNIGSGKTVFYSYWLNAAAVYLSHSDKLDGIRICRAHGGDCFFDRGYVPWRKDVIANLDKVFSVCDGGKDDIMLHYGRAVENIEKRIAVSRLGVELSGTVKDVPRSDDEHILVTCSNVIPLKRLDLMIHALADQSIRHRIRWVHFGDGSQFEEITALASKCLDDSVNVSYEFKGRTPKNEILRYYQETPVALFVNCSDVEGIPVSIMEAMSYGIPAVARDVGSIRELVNDSCGALLPGKITPEELAACIDRLLDENDEEHHRKRIAAAQMIRNHYCSADNYREFFIEVETMLQEKAHE